MTMPAPLLLTDLYQLTMLEAYFDAGMSEPAVFEFFVREMPADRNFLMAAGLEQTLEFLQQLRLSDDEYQWLKRTGRFRADFLDYLAELRFTGDVHAVPEGTIFFPDEPLLSVTAPIPEAQLIESRVINLLQFQTLIASKAARCVLMAPGRNLVDFGLRRAHGAEAGLLAARASHVAGFDGTATVLAGQYFDIPIFGTVAHSFILAHDSETGALEDFARSYGDRVTLLIDTYDTEACAREVVALAPRLARDGISILAVRIDSGDLAAHARKVRAILDEGGRQEIRIFASGGLDEHALRDLLSGGAPIDGFGIGSRLDTSADVPYLDCAYKLTEYAGRGRRKWSEGKATLPGRKQVFRVYDADGAMAADTVTTHDDEVPGRPLLAPVMQSGARACEPETLRTIRERAAEQLASLPGALASLEPASRYPVTISQRLRAAAARVDAAIVGG
jgi:nicotinate phosphoribosyltransferase